MKQLVYVIRYLLKERGSSLIKVISLTLGLVVGLVLYSQVAFELSYDNFYPDKEQIYRIRRTCMSGEKETYGGALIYTPMPRTMRTDLKEVQSATLTSSSTDEITFQRQEQKYVEKVLSVDEHFQEVFSFNLLSGDIKKLEQPYQVVLSQSAATRIFGDQNPVGESLSYIQHNYKKIPVTVAGVIEDVPDNSQFDFDVLLSIQTVFALYGRQPGWLENDNYVGYVKLKAGTTADEVEARIPAMLANCYDVKALESGGNNQTYSLDAVSSLHKNDPEVKKLLLILTLLASSLLVVSVMNYVLTSISSLVKRSRLIGVYKTCGATNGNIFARFMLETVLLVLVSLLLSVFILFLCREPVEELIRMPVAAVFSASNLWVVCVLVAALTLIAGVVPAQLFSAIPAAQAFRSGSVNKRYWKNILLFIQFTSVTIICCLLLVIVRQYRMMVEKDWGYTTEHVWFVKLHGVPGDRINRIKTEFERIPSVACVSMSTNIPIYGMNGDVISDPETQRKLFPYKLMGADTHFLSALQISLLSGNNFETDGDNEQDVLVNEAFMKKMGEVGFPADKVFRNLDGNKRIIGVVNDFQLLNLYHPTEPLMICSVDPARGVWWENTSYLIVRTTKRTSQLLDELNKTLFLLTQNDNLVFKDYKTIWTAEYETARLFRNSVIMASVIMFLIMLLGLIGYVEDELVRRNREIAIRKINGASTIHILYRIANDFSYVVIPAMVLGVLVSYPLGSSWLSQFVEKVPLDILPFILSCLLLIAIMLACLCLRSWRVANTNPIHSLQADQ